MEKSENSFWKRFGFYGGLVALVLSIGSGSYNLVELILLKPTDPTASHEARLAPPCDCLAVALAALLVVFLSRCMTIAMRQETDSARPLRVYGGTLVYQATQSC